MSIVSFMDRRFYPDYCDNWDDVEFRSQILALIEPYHHVLDVGAGAGIVAPMNFRGHCAKVVGVDLDPRVLENPFLDEAAVTDAVSLPFDDNSFDLVFSDNVMEHLDDPKSTLREIRRVLKSGGCLVFKTPNKRHYMPLIARMTPHGFHRWVNRLRGRDAVDTFPTRYRCNSRSQLERLCSQTDLNIEDISFLEGRPEYMRFSPLTYLIGLVYERTVNVSRIFASWRVVMIATLSKPIDN